MSSKSKISKREHSLEIIKIIYSLHNFYHSHDQIAAHLKILKSIVIKIIQRRNKNFKFFSQKKMIRLIF